MASPLQWQQLNTVDRPTHNRLPWSRPTWHVERFPCRRPTSTNQLRLHSPRSGLLCSCKLAPYWADWSLGEWIADKPDVPILEFGYDHSHECALTGSSCSQFAMNTGKVYVHFLDEVQSRSTWRCAYMFMRWLRRDCGIDSISNPLHWH